MSGDLEDELLTTKEVGNLLKFSDAQIRKFITEGKIQAVKCGRHWRVRRTEVDKILDQGF
ncbi:MAG: helix-turn-helix domain-containing protein [Methanofollis sp.]|nr:helix-turn-helix domain-containing protein [Methanofollis sp.]